ncbi:MAG: precorrin-6Y C5 15-methyltransferase / precorrin-8W decarboxylase [Nitrospirae bacterium]|nr:MAG: precorrin-6Y C5 15-methyltransferase / precorrin-8W decarboxylase [Nitrospirota bacterium]
MNKLYIMGIGYKPIDKKSRGIIAGAQVILASKRLSEVFREYEEYEAVKDKVKVISNVDKTIEFIHSAISNQQSAINNIVLLASGDPLFFGIGRRAVKEFGKDMVEILPDLSSIQMAFARIKEAWDDAFLMSLHGGPDPGKRRRLLYEINDIPALLQRHNKIAILTDEENNPAEIAKILLKPSAVSYQLSAVRMFVCERLAYQDEKVTEGTPEGIAGMEFSEPNVVIIRNFPQPSALSPQLSAFGLKETEITHSRGLITKDEARAVAIHKLRFPLKGVFWDIGAGSGSISVEAARLCPGLRVFAVEKDDEEIRNIKENKIRFDANNIEIIKGNAPEALTNLPSPERVFIGGSGGKLKEIIDLIAKTQASIAVINAATIETLNEAVQNLEKSGFTAGVSEISVSRSKTVAGKKHMSALNPVFIITGEKQT